MRKVKKELEKLYNLYTSFIDALIANVNGLTKSDVDNLLEEYDLKIAACKGNKAGAESARDLMGKEYYRATLQAYQEIQEKLRELVKD